MRILPLVCVFLVPGALGAQATIKSSTVFRADPGGTALATIHAGAAVAAGVTRSGWTRITLEGYVHRSVVGGKRASFAISARGDGVQLRATPSRRGTVVARLEDEMGLVQVSRTGEWVHVRRSGWVTSRAVAAPPARIAAARPRPIERPRAAAPRDTTTQSEAAGDVAPDTVATAASTLVVQRRTALALAPGGGAVATVDSATRVTTLARDRDWVRVQVDGWVRAADLGPVVGSMLTTISAADLRAQPDKYRAQVVRWQVQKIAVETADPLRKGLAPDEPYLLARGPGSENSLLYLALPPSLVDEAKRIEPLATVLVTARVRAGRSEPAGVPLLDVLSLASP